MSRTCNLHMLSTSDRERETRNEKWYLMSGLLSFGDIDWLSDGAGRSLNEGGTRILQASSKQHMHSDTAFRA